MKPWFSRGRLALLSCSSILLMSLTALAQVRVDNTSQYVNPSTFTWRIFIQADKTTLADIGCVEYRLDPSFAKSVRLVCNLGDPRYPFAESGEALKSFKVGVTVKFKTRKPFYTDYSVKLSREIPVTKLFRIIQNTSKVLDQSPFNNQVAIYISNGNYKSFRLKVYENFDNQKALFESNIYSADVKANFYYRGQPYVVRGTTRGVGTTFDLYCTVYREVIK
jgi:hypothetical protein